MGNDLWGRRDLLAFAGVAGLSALSGLVRARPTLLGRPAADSAYHKAVLASRPAGYWRLGERGGATAHDASGHGRDGNYVGHPHLGQPGAIRDDQDRAIALDGAKTKSYVAIPDSNAFSIATSGHGLTVEVWLRPDRLDFPGERPDPDHAYIHWLGKGDKGHYEWGFRFYSRRASRPNRISAYVWNPEGRLGAGAYIEERLVPQQWIYLVATLDDPRQPNARVRLYKDGAPSPHNDSPGTLYRNYAVQPKRGRAPIRLGTRDLRSFLTGGLDEVAIYPRVLPANEILRHWRAAHHKAGPRYD